jgi:lambda repressor-like predicted transcriptional regulator
VAKQGRPRGININPAAVESFLDKACLSKSELCTEAGIKPGHLADMLRRRKGASPLTIRRMATALRVPPEAIAPELSGWFVAVREGDPTESTDEAA